MRRYSPGPSPALFPPAKLFRKPIEFSPPQSGKTQSPNVIRLYIDSATNCSGPRFGSYSWTRVEPLQRPESNKAGMQETKGHPQTPGAGGCFWRCYVVPLKCVQKYEVLR